MSRHYTLSDAAIKQRRIASQSAASKRMQRDSEPVRAISEPAHISKAEILEKFPQLPANAPNSDHQRRAAQIRAYKIQNGMLTKAERGGRKKLPTECPRCHVMCEGARDAWTHCLSSRKKKSLHFGIDLLPDV